MSSYFPTQLHGVQLRHVNSLGSLRIPANPSRTSLRVAPRAKNDQKNEGVYFEYEAVDPDALKEVAVLQAEEEETFNWAHRSRELKEVAQKKNRAMDRAYGVRENEGHQRNSGKRPEGVPAKGKQPIAPKAAAPSAASTATPSTLKGPSRPAPIPTGSTPRQPQRPTSGSVTSIRTSTPAKGAATKKPLAAAKPEPTAATKVAPTAGAAPVPATVRSGAIPASPEGDKDAATQPPSAAAAPAPTATAGAAKVAAITGAAAAPHESRGGSGSGSDRRQRLLQRMKGTGGSGADAAGLGAGAGVADDREGVAPVAAPSPPLAARVGGRDAEGSALRAPEGSAGLPPVRERTAAGAAVSSAAVAAVGATAAGAAAATPAVSSTPASTSAAIQSQPGDTRAAPLQPPQAPAPELPDADSSLPPEDSLPPDALPTRALLESILSPSPDELLEVTSGDVAELVERDLQAQREFSQWARRASTARGPASSSSPSSPGPGGAGQGEAERDELEDEDDVEVGEEDDGGDDDDDVRLALREILELRSLMEQLDGAAAAVPGGGEDLEGDMTNEEVLAALKIRDPALYEMLRDVPEFDKLDLDLDPDAGAGQDLAALEKLAAQLAAAGGAGGGVADYDDDDDDEGDNEAELEELLREMRGTGLVRGDGNAEDQDLNGGGDDDNEEDEDDAAGDPLGDLLEAIDEDEELDPRVRMRAQYALQSMFNQPADEVAAKGTRGSDMEAGSLGTKGDGAGAGATKRTGDGATLPVRGTTGMARGEGRAGKEDGGVPSPPLLPRPTRK